MNTQRADTNRPRSAQIGPSWHAWISYLVDKSPAEDPLLQSQHRPWDKDGAIPNYTGTRGAFKTYSTFVSPSPTPRVHPGARPSMLETVVADMCRTAPKLKAWEPVVAERR